MVQAAATARFVVDLSILNSPFPIPSSNITAANMPATAQMITAGVSNPMRLTLLAAALLAAPIAHAVEGMWMPEQLPEISEALRSAGLEIDADTLTDLTAHPMGAIVSLGGCTASFVSPQGLVATNHHCAYGAIQLNSTEQRNLLRDGFNAENLADEPSAGPASRIFVTESIRDVTDQVLADIAADTDDRARFDAIDAARKALVAECEEGGGYRCNVFSYFGGLQYRLFRQMEIRDVRLVYAPPEGIGKFGGDVDNWMWPRHTGDFAFYRAYVGPDGKPAAFAEDNRPYEPAHFLKIARDGLAIGDFAMVAGYPGTTSRYRLASEIEHTVDWTYPRLIDMYGDLVGIVNAAGAPGSDVAIRYAASIASWNNVIKNYRGQLDGFARAGAVQAKHDQEGALAAWLQQQGADGHAAHTNLIALRAHIERARDTRERALLTNYFPNFGLLGAARDLYRLSIEREQPAEQRESGYQPRDEARLEGTLRQLERRMDPAVDRQVSEYWLRRYLALAPELRLPELDAWLGVEATASEAPQLGERLDALYAGTQLGDTEARLRWFNASRAEIEASDDPFLQFAVQLMPALLRLEAERKTHDGGLQRLTPGYMQAMIDFQRSQGRAAYPDANGSLRITFGTVQGADPRDGLRYLPFTTTAGIADKHTGEDPFDATAAQLQAIRAKRWGGREVAALNDVPVNYLADLDVTGGNSGSPTLNARGELVGLIFDMTWESVASNWVFNPVLTRTIHVDSRYMMWVMEQVFPAPRVLQELQTGE
jgi:hypothetical protein